MSFIGLANPTYVPHFWKDQVHGVVSVLWILRGYLKHHWAINGEHPSQEPVNQSNLDDKVGQGEELTEHVSEEVLLVTIDAPGVEH